MIERIEQRLEALGCSLVDADKVILRFAFEKVENNLKNTIHVKKIPQELDQVVIDRVAGEFLLAKKQTGQLTEFDLDVAEKQVSLGDTTVSFNVDAASSPEQRLDKLINHLVNTGKKEAKRFRKLVW